MGLWEKAQRYRKAYKNWISFMWAIYENRYPIKLKLRNGLQIESTPSVATLISRLLYQDSMLYQDSNINITKSVSDNRLELVLEGKSIIFFGWLYGILSDLPGYDWLDVKGKRVLDVGASIGDTAVYFAVKGASEVVAFEPYPFP